VYGVDHSSDFFPSSKDTTGQETKKKVWIKRGVLTKSTGVIPHVQTGTKNVFIFVRVESQQITTD
jgi:hypothetical protein